MKKKKNKLANQFKTMIHLKDDLITYFFKSALTLQCLTIC